MNPDSQSDEVTETCQPNLPDTKLVNTDLTILFGILIHMQQYPVPINSNLNIKDIEFTKRGLSVLTEMVKDLILEDIKSD